MILSRTVVEVGTGYALMVKGELGFREPGSYTFLNRGISGNRIVDVYARIKADIINLTRREQEISYPL